MINFVIIAVFIITGALLKRFGVLPESASRWITQFVIFACLPSVVLLNVPKMSLQPALALPVLTPWFGVVLFGLMILFLGQFLSWQKSMVGCVLMVTCFGNTSFFGFPMVEAFWGKSGLPYAIVFDLMGSFLSLAILGNIILAVYSGDEKFSWLKTFKKLVTFPPFIAIVFALVFSDWQMPSFLTGFLQLISSLLVPSTMMLVGMHMSLKVSRSLQLPLALVLLLKLLVFPLVIWLFIKSINLDVTSNLLINQVSVFEAAMPPMVTASVLAMHAELEPKLAASAVGIGLIVSCLTLPLWYLLLR